MFLWLGSRLAQASTSYSWEEAPEEHLPGLLLYLQYASLALFAAEIRLIATVRRQKLRWRGHPITGGTHDYNPDFFRRYTKSDQRADRLGGAPRRWRSLEKFPVIRSCQDSS